LRTLSILLFVTAVTTLPGIAQTPIVADDDSTFRVRATVFAGLLTTIYDQPPTTQSTSTTYLGNALGGRLVWHPNHLLAVGVQSGFVFFSTDDLVIDGVESGRAGLAAVPLHMVLTMSSKGFEFGMGLGIYQLQSIWRLRGLQRAESSEYEYGINPWFGYDFPISNRFTLGPEIGAHVLSNRGVQSVYLGIKTSADVLRYWDRLRGKPY